MSSGYPNTVVLRHLEQALVDLLGENICLTEGVRNVVQWRWSNHGLDEELFRPFVGVDSETDRFPIGKVRNLWNAGRLQEIDAERLVTESHYRAWVLESGKSLLAAIRAILPKSMFSDPSHE